MSYSNVVPGRATPQQAPQPGLQPIKNYKDMLREQFALLERPWEAGLSQGQRDAMIGQAMGDSQRRLGEVQTDINRAALAGGDTGSMMAASRDVGAQAAQAAATARGQVNQISNQQAQQQLMTAQQSLAAEAARVRARNAAIAKALTGTALTAAAPLVGGAVATAGMTTNALAGAATASTMGSLGGSLLGTSSPGSFADYYSLYGSLE